MNKNNYTIIVFVLALLAALQPLCIDLYLPAFSEMATALHTNMGNIQLSFSVFLGGFALGQLLWGPLSDYLGRKKPIQISLLIFTISSFALIWVVNIGQLWALRFVQALGGAAGAVIGRAMVNELFEEKKRAKVFSLLVIIAGVAPIIAPTIGNLLMKTGNWQSIFMTMGALGIISLFLVGIYLPESRTVKIQDGSKSTVFSLKNVIRGYGRVAANRQYMKYTLIGCMAFTGLMLYVSNAPFLIMEKGGFSSDIFTLIFAVNAIGLIIGNYSVSLLARFFSLEKIISCTIYIQAIIVVFLLVLASMNASIMLLLSLIFIILFSIGILLPATTTIALIPFTSDSGTASAFMGFMQMLFSFILSGVLGLLQYDSVLPLIGSLFFCAFSSFAFLYLRDQPEMNPRVSIEV